MSEYPETNYHIMCECQSSECPNCNPDMLRSPQLEKLRIMRDYHERFFDCFSTNLGHYMREGDCAPAKTIRHVFDFGYKRLKELEKDVEDEKARMLEKEE